MSVVKDFVLFLVKEVIGPDQYTRARDWWHRRRWASRLTKRVKNEAGRPPRAYRRWLRRPHVAAALAHHEGPNDDQLVYSLASELAKRRLGRDYSPEPERARPLVELSKRFYEESLDDEDRQRAQVSRIDHTTQSTAAALTASADFATNLEKLPSTARRPLILDGGPDAQRLASAVAQSNAPEVVAGLVSHPPRWLENASQHVHLGLAELARAHRLPAEAATTYRKVGDLAHDRVRMYAYAAFEFRQAGRTTESDECLELAQALGQASVVGLVAAAIENDGDGVIAAGPSDEAMSDPFTASLYAEALRREGDLDVLVRFLKAAINADPGAAGLRILLAQALTGRVVTGGSTARAADLSLAEAQAVEARDLRRAWNGQSSDAVFAACQAAMIARRFDRVLALATTEPDGEATAGEAAAADVQFIAVEASMAIGAGDDSSTRPTFALDEFQRALLNARTLHINGGTPDEVERLFEIAWALAESAIERLDYWIAAAAAGVPSLRGDDDLDREDPNLQAVIRGTHLIARCRPVDAIAMLRPIHSSEQARSTLVHAYVANDRIDLAVAELRDMAERFDNPEHLVTIVGLHIDAGSHDQAVAAADNALRLTPPTSADRDRLHQAAIIARHGSSEWGEIEQRCRAWINDTGGTPRARWLLVQALLNQAEAAKAVRTIYEEPQLEPLDPLDGLLWIAAHVRTSPSTDWLPGALALTRQFPDDAELRDAAVGAFMSRPGDTPVDPADLDEWQRLLKVAAADPRPDSAISTIRFEGDDPDALAKAFQPHLELQAQLLLDILPGVERRGYPHGAIAMVSGRQYATALVALPVACLPIHRSDDPTEIDAARRALDTPVLVDTSTVAVGRIVADHWPTLTSCFSSVTMSTEARLDIAAAVHAAQSPTVGSVSWDLDRGQPAFIEADPASIAMMRDRLAWIDQAAKSLVIAPTPTAGLEQDDRMRSWIGIVRIAQEDGRPIWVDDIGLRDLARNEGCTVFGTTALIAALQDVGRMSPARAPTIIATLWANFCVDLPVEPERVRRSAEEANWQGGPAWVWFTRSAAWADLSAGIELLRAVVNDAGSADPLNTPRWAYAAIRGLLARFELEYGPVLHHAQPNAHSLIAGIAITSALASANDPTAFAAIVEGASTACFEFGLAPPGGQIARSFLGLLEQRLGTAPAVQQLATLGSQLPPSFREAWTAALLGLDSPGAASSVTHW